MPVKIFSQAPFIRFIIPFILGIITAIHTQHPVSTFNFLIAVLFATLIFLFSFKVFAIAYKFRWISGFIISTLFYFSGYQLTILKTQKFDPHHFGNYINEADAYFVKITEAPVEKEKSIKVNATVISVKQGKEWINSVGKSLIYFKKDSLSENIRYGDCIILKTKFNLINPPQNPGEFNYKEYLAFRNICHQSYVPSAHWTFSGINDGNILIANALSLREKFLRVFKENHIEGDEYAVGSALILGYEDKLDSDIISAYSATGAMHILSVSGLHVAIVYIVFNWLLGFLHKFNKGNVLKAFSLILLIWFYALLTGLSASVLRATTMFSFIIVGKSFNRYTNIYNTLAASCFLLLFTDPYLIMDVGFQLSYLAVLGIVFLQTKIYSLWEPQNWLLDQVWQITSVSIAAQLATFPLGLFYFHQFPNYFLFSNLLVIPLSTLVLYSGILLFVVSKITIMASVVATTLKYLIFFLNESVRVMEHFPYAIAGGISLTVMETWLIYLSIISIICFLIYKSINHLRFFLLSVILLIAIQCIESYQQRQQKIIVVYSVSKISAFDFIDGKRNIFYADSSLSNNEGKMLFHVKPNWWNLGLERQTIIANRSGSGMDKTFFFVHDHIQFHDKKIAIVNKPFKFLTKKRIRVNYLILSENAACKIADLINMYDFDKLIIDSSNSRWKAERWIEEAQKLNVEYYSVIHSGAFLQEI